MRIALFTETFYPKVDGISNTLAYLLKHLARRGHQSMLFAPEGAPVRFAMTRVIGLPSLPFPLYPELHLVPPVLNVEPYLDQFRPDVIHIVNPTSLGLLGLWHAKQRDLPLVASYHTDVPGFAERWGMGYLKDAIWSYYRFIHNLADLNLAPSTFTQHELVEQGFERVKVWSRGVDTRLFHPSRRSQSMRERLTDGHPADRLLVYIGRLSMEKRIDWLAPIMRSMPDVRLAIVGEGPMRPELERIFAGTKTVFAGYMRGEELAQAYASSDIFVFTGANETFGNVVQEAKASGLPVVAPNSGGVLDHVTHEHDGLLFDAEDPQDLIHQVQRLLVNPDLLQRLSQSAFVSSQSRSWESVLDILMDDYAQLAGKPALELTTKPREITRPVLTSPDAPNFPRYH